MIIVYRKMEGKKWKHFQLMKEKEILKKYDNNTVLNQKDFAASVNITPSLSHTLYRTRFQAPALAKFCPLPPSLLLPCHGKRTRKYV